MQVAKEDGMAAFQQKSLIHFQPLLSLTRSALNPDEQLGVEQAQALVKKLDCKGKESRFTNHDGRND